VVRPRSCRVIYYFDTPALGRRHQSFGRVTHALNSFQTPNHNPYSQTYNPGWRNHPNFNWKSDNNNAQTSQPPFQAHHNFQNSHGYAHHNFQNSNKITNVIMLTIYNPIGTSFVCGFQLNKKGLYYTCLKYH